MTSPTENQHRLEAVELKLMDLENSLSELNDVIIRQYAEIDALKTQQHRFIAQIEQLESGGDPSQTSDPAQERPPHY